jgi:hypothetical protein
MRIAAIAKPHSALTSGARTSTRSRTWESVAGDPRRPLGTERRKYATDFEDLRCLSSEPVRIRVFRDGGSCCSRRRVLHCEWRSSSSWLRLSEHGAMQGGVLRHRRRMFARAQRPVTRECPSPSTQAGTPTKRAPFQYYPQKHPRPMIADDARRGPRVLTRRPHQFGRYSCAAGTINQAILGS